MMPPPRDIAALVDRAEAIVVSPPLVHYPAESKRRLLAEAVFDVLRHNDEPSWTAVQVPL